MPTFRSVKLRTSCLFLAACLAPLSAQDSPKQRGEWFYRQRAYPQQSIPPGARTDALAQMDRMRAREGQADKSSASKSAAASADRWTMIGPRPESVLLTPPYGPPIASGRVSALAVDPRNPDVAYAGGATGGVWKTTDGGINWTPLTDDQPSLAIGSIALAPSNPDIVYAGTGEQNFSGDSYYGAGVLKSMDAGATWKHLPGSFVGPFSATSGGGGYRIGAIAVSPTNPNIVLAGGSREIPGESGIFRSTDGGESWIAVLTGSAGTGIVFDPTNPDIVYSAIGRTNGDLKYGVFKSIDAGATWTAANGTGANALPITGGGRIEIAIAPSSPRTLYVSIATQTSTLRGVFKTVDGAQNWTSVPSVPDYCAPQCNYDNAIAVHPQRPDVVVVAGDAFGTFQSNGIYRTLNGGTTWASIFLGANGNSPHSDHHALAFSRDGGRLYDGNDGGVYRADDVSAGPVNWTNLNNTLAITSMSSGFAMDPLNPNIIYAGTQDNGTLKYTGGLQWDQIFGGDGEQAQVDFSLPTTVYVTTPGIDINKITDQGNFQAYVPVTHGINRNDRSGFTAAFAMDSSNPDRLYFGTYRVYQSTDAAGLWQAISPDLTNNNTGAIVNTIAVAPSYPNVVYAGTTNGRVQITYNALEGTGANWGDHSQGLPLRTITYLAVDPLDPLTAYATFSGFSGFNRDAQGHIFRTSDGGIVWTDISGNLPNIPVNELVIDPDILNTFYAGTDIGVFRTADGGATWSTLSNGLPNIVVLGLKLHRRSRTLRAATHGRSMWELAVPLAAPSRVPTIASATPNRLNAGAADLTITVTGTNFVPDSVVRWNGVDRPTAITGTTVAHVGISASDVAFAGRGTLLVFNSGPGGGNSNTLNIVIGPAPVLTSAGVVNSANPSGGSVLVPGSIASIYGANLALRTITASPSATSPQLPTTLDGIKVELVGSTPVPLLFVSPTQINFQAPWRTAGFTTAILTVTNGALTSNPVTVSIANYAPAIYTLNGKGTGQGAVLIAGTAGTVAAPAGSSAKSRPAKKGEIVEIYANGLGDVTRNPPTGGITPNSPLAITRTPTVTVGGVAAKVSFSGLTPGSVGLFQINVQVPADAPSGDAIPISLEIGGVKSNTATIAIE